jgi:hypothetical protein
VRRGGIDTRGSHRSVAQWKGRGPTNHRREFDSLRSDNSRRSRGKRRASPGANHRGRSGTLSGFQTTTTDSLHSDPARVSIWRGCPAVYRVRRVRFPSRAQTRCSSRQSGCSISGWLAGSNLPTGTTPPRCCRRHARSVSERAGFEIPVAAPTRSWRNRQTHQPEGLARKTSWEFDSPRAHNDRLAERQTRRS